MNTLVEKFIMWSVGAKNVFYDKQESTDRSELDLWSELLPAVMFAKISVFDNLNDIWRYCIFAM